MTWQELNEHDLVVYSTSWCGDCRRLKRVFAENGVRYREHDIDADADAAVRLKKATGRGAIPFVQIDGGPFVRGWHDEAPGKFSAEIFFREIDAALGQ
jgi:glutaredoxin